MIQLNVGRYIKIIYLTSLFKLMNKIASSEFMDYNYRHINDNDISKIESENLNDNIKYHQILKKLDRANGAAFLCQSKIKNPNYYSIIDCNNKFESLFKIEKSKIIGKSYDFLLQEFDIDYSSESQLEHFRLIRDLKDFHPCTVIVEIFEYNSRTKSKKYKIDFEPQEYIDQLNRRHALFIFNQISQKDIKNNEVKKYNIAKNSDLIKNMERTLRNERLLRKVSSYIISDLPISEISYKIAKEICDNFQIDRCIIHDYRDSQTNFVTEYDRIDSTPLFQGIHNDDNVGHLTKYINFQNKFCKKYLQKDDKSFVCAINNLQIDSNFKPIKSVIDKFKIGAQISITTIFNRKINGGIYLHQSQPRNWMADEIETMEIISDQMSIAFDRSVTIEKVMIGNHALMEKTTELKHALKKEQEMRRMQNEFVALVSHEFKTPLQIIDGTREVLQRKIKKTTNDENILKYLNRIKTGIDRMNGLITSTLNLAKMESGDGKITVEIEEFNFKEFILEIINKNKNLADNKKIKIITKLDSLPISFKADPKLLDHSFNNILSNAIKYSRNNSTIKIISKCNDKYIAIKFIDSGIGIPKNDLKNIGKKFYRAKNTLSVAGTGIGLYLSQHFIELHSGKLYIDSEVNIGTSVTVILPI